MIGEKTIQLIDEALIEDLKTELRQQGHYLTGELENSIVQKKVKSGDGIAEEIYAEDYIDPLSEGIPASQYVADIPGLTRYAELRFGAVGQRATAIAYAIAAKHKREGMPTHNSYQFSKNGRRTESIEEVFDRNPDLDPAVEEGLDKEITELFNFPDLTIF